MNKKKLIPLLALPVIWGSYYVASHEALAIMSVFSVGIVIRAITMVLLTVLMGVKGQLRSLFRVKYVWKWLCMIGLMGFLLDTTAFIGLQLSPAGIGTALLKCDILFVNLISVIVYKERFTAMDWLLSLVMLLGVFLVLDIDFAHLDLFNLGNIFFILSALFVSINAFLIKEAQRHPKNPVSDNVIAYYNNFITLVLFTCAAAVTGQIKELGHLTENSYLMWALLASGLGQTLIYIVYYYDLRRNPVWIVKVILLLMPIVSAVLGLVLFGDTMSAVQCLGLVIVLTGALCILVTHHRREVRQANETQFERK